MGNYKKKKRTQNKIDSDILGASKNDDIVDEFRRAMDDAAVQSDTSSILEKGFRNELDETLWINKTLLSFPDFCGSADHMRFPPLSDRQQRVADFMFGEDPKRMFENGRNTAVLCWGKGGGKDTISSLMLLYVVYVLLNLKNPQRFLGLPDNASIDLLNIAASKEQAQTVYFQIFKTMVLNWQWLRGQWDIVINGRFFSSGQEGDADFANKVTVTNDAVLFPKNIRCFSGSAEAETLEGKNLLAFVLDEADAFKIKSLQRSASKIYRVVRTSATSRFGNKFKGFVISYPRSENGFILKLYEQSKKFLNMYSDLAKTWEVKPRALFSSDTFEFEGDKIPMDFYEDFRLDPMGAKASYLCRPPKAESLFLEDSDKVELATKGFSKPLFDFRDITLNNMVRKIVSHAPILYDKSILHTLTLDLSVRHDATAMCLAHREGDKILVDFVTAWVPDSKNKIEVDLANVEEIIDSVRREVTVKLVGCDHWNSALLNQKLHGKGVNSETVKLEFDDFEIFKRLLYAGNIVLPRHQRLLNELKNLQMVSSRKVDHPEGMHNDMAVTVIMAVKLLLRGKAEGGMVGMSTEGEYIGENLHEAANDNSIFFKTTPEEGIQIDGIPL